MKCEKCFFCCHIGKGIYADYPVKYCRHHKKYLLPFVETQDNGGTKRQLDFSNIKDCKIWHEVGCNIHPSSYLISGKWASGKWRSGEESVGECEYSQNDGYFKTSWNFDVLAWKPLPEPYKEEVKHDER